MVTKHAIRLILQTFLLHEFDRATLLFLSFFCHRQSHLPPLSFLTSILYLPNTHHLSDHTMWIKQVIIDGFKSYAHRTVVGPFDREFNAITGLNGSGKSNVLDAICFVFAISNLSQVRVHDLRELIYKSGQAGIHKASVTIDFDNSDRDASPPAYIDHKTITVTRQIHTGNKFFINGSTATLGQVQNLFHSVQLNVNNPHFLIMQGTISKVLNMKPAARLSMLEEAAGTRMFEQKKTMAQQMVQKKDMKLGEIDRQLEDDMKPTLEKREKDRRDYDQYIQSRNQIEVLSRMKLAYDYEHLFETCTNLRGEVLQAQNTEMSAEQDVKDLRNTIEEMTLEIQQQKSTHQQSLTYGLGSSQKEYDDSYKVLVTKQTDLQHLQEDVAKQGELVTSLKAKNKRFDASLTQHHETVKKAHLDLKAHDASHSELEVGTDNLQRQLALLKSGIAASSEGVSLTEQLERYKKQLTTAEGDTKNAELIKQRSATQLAAKKKQAGADDKEYEAVKVALAREQALLAEEEDALKRATGGYSEEREKHLRDFIEEKQGVISTLEHELRRLQTVVQTRVEVQYEGNRQPKELAGRVKGVVLKLLDVKDRENICALTQAAGRGLYNIVVDNEATGKELVKKVKNRITVIPLNQIQDGVISQQALQMAEQVARRAGGSAELALDLIDYDDEVGAAMRFVFGKRIVCSDLKTASAVTFHKDIKQVTVTTQGEVVQPGGVMRGGSTRDLDMNLAHYLKYKELVKDLDQHRAELVKAEQELQGLLEAAARFREQEASLRIMKRKVEGLQYQLSSNQRHQLMEQAAKLETDIREAEETLATGTAKATHLHAEIKKLEGSMKKGGNLDDEIKRVTTEIAKNKKDQKELAPKRSETMRIVAEADATEADLRAELERAHADGAEEAAKLTQFQTKVSRAKKELAHLNGIVSGKEAHMQELKDKLNEANSGLQNKEQDLSALKDNEAELRVALQECKRRVGELEALKKERQARLLTLEKSDFVTQNRHLFDKKGSDLDWRSIDYVKDFARLEAMKQQHSAAGKTVNHKVVSMYEAVAEQYNDVLSKRNQVARDREHVLSTITELNTQKKHTIEETFKKVSLDFSAIFSTLLPGAKAKLVPDRDDDDDISGLSIHAAMGNSWKDSLTELSGGQRSLLALSYILSLLKYKPAPVYILDEVDAALDLSHTQNIGKMLASHFKKSQFLVVSLKEGMFNNANVLFRVRLVDGQSQITRNDNTAIAQKRKGTKRPREED